MVLNYTGNDQKCTHVHLVASELGLPICCLLREMHAISGCNSVNSFSHTGKITAFQTFKHKLDKLWQWQCDQLRWIFLTLFKITVCCYFNSICMLLYDENKSGSDVSELRYRMFTKKNLGGDRLPPTLGQKK